MGSQDFRTRSSPVEHSNQISFVAAPDMTVTWVRCTCTTWGIGADGSTYDTWTQNLTITSADPGAGKRFGHRIEANDNGDILAVSSVSTGQAGKVEIYIRIPRQMTVAQIILSHWHRH